MAKGAAIQKNTAMPEFITNRKDIDPRTWTVEEGAAQRGEAWTDMDNARMKVPFGDDETSRVIRAHELMHARVSPLQGSACVSLFPDINPRSIIAAEEFRVNTLVKRAGFNVDELRDGSEFRSGELSAQRGDWDGCVVDVGAMAGTKACADFLRGVKKVDEDWAKALREIEKSLISAAKKVPSRYLANTEDRDGYPRGFSEWTRKFAEILKIAQELGNRPKIDEDGNVSDEESEAIDSDKMKEALGKTAKGKGRSRGFAPMVLETLPLTRRVGGHLGRKRIATNTGRNPRRINRMLTDPQRRVFDRTIKGTGGVVLIDQSGSMSLGEKDLWAILEAAPGCTVIGYSHRPDSTNYPNVWVLAENGKVCETIRSGNGGNGVDGPALEFALKKRKKGESLIWLCDGMVTDSYDHYHDSLAEQCASVVVRNNVYMTGNIQGVIEALEKVKKGVRLPVKATGEIKHTSAFKGR